MDKRITVDEQHLDLNKTISEQLPKKEIYFDNFNSASSIFDNGDICDINIRRNNIPENIQITDVTIVVNGPNVIIDDKGSIQ